MFRNRQDSLPEQITEGKMNPREKMKTGRILTAQELQQFLTPNLVPLDEFSSFNLFHFSTPSLVIVSQKLCTISTSFVINETAYIFHYFTSISGIKRLNLNIVYLSIHFSTKPVFPVICLSLLSESGWTTAQSRHVIATRPPLYTCTLYTCTL